jgi:hypothetical protein
VFFLRYKRVKDVGEFHFCTVNAVSQAKIILWQISAMTDIDVKYAAISQFSKIYQRGLFDTTSNHQRCVDVKSFDTLAFLVNCSRDKRKILSQFLSPSSF